MLVFLAPLALFGMGLLIVPILAHLFKPRRVRVIPFSSLRWLRASRHKLSRRLQWHQLLLFLLRAGFLTLLVLTLAKPVMNSGGSIKVTNRVVVIDTGRTMAYAAPDRLSPIALANTAAAELIRENPGRIQTAVISANSRASILIPPTQDPGKYAQRLHLVQPEPSETDFSAVFRILPSLLSSGAEEKSTELVVLTDLMAASWSQGDIAHFMREFASPLHVRILDSGVSRPQNAWIAEAQLGAKTSNNSRILEVTLGASGDQAHDRVLRLSGIPGLPDQTRKVSLSPDHPGAVLFEIPSDAAITGAVARFTLEPHDALASDDVYWLPLVAQANLRILIVEPASTQIAELQPAFHLRIGLESLAAASHENIEITTRAPSALLPADLADTDVIIFSDIYPISDESMGTLMDRVREGAGLAVFMGPDLDKNFHNTKMHNPLTPEASLLPFEIIDSINSASGAQRLTGIQWEHPLLHNLSDPAYGDLADVSIRKFHNLRLDNNRSDLVVPACINGGAPAILSSGFGAGHVLVFNTTANDTWSDLPRRKSFVPVLDGMITHLAGAWRRRIFQNGEAVILPLPPGSGPAVVTAPSGRELPTSLRHVAGRQVLQLDAAPESGIYGLSLHTSSGQIKSNFVVQPGRRTSPMQRISENTLRQWWAPAHLEVTAADPYAVTGMSVPWQKSFGPWLLLLALLVFLAEMALVHRACPKAPPPISEQASITSNGFFGPSPHSTRTSET